MKKSVRSNNPKSNRRESNLFQEKKGQFIENALSITSAMIGFIVIMGIIVVIAYIPEADLGRWGTSIKTIGKYLYGINEVTLGSITLGGSSNTFGVGNMTTAAIVITAFMIWMVFFFAMGDIISTFGAFAKPVSWAIALALGVIAGLTGLISNVVVWMTGIFIWAGIAGIYLGLLLTIAAFIAVNIGNTAINRWVLRRKAGIMAARTGYGTEETKQAIRGLRGISTELGRTWDKAR